MTNTNLQEEKDFESASFNEVKDLKVDVIESEISNMVLPEDNIEIPDMQVEPMILPRGAFTIGKKPEKDMEKYRKQRNKRNKAAKKSRKINRK